MKPSFLLEEHALPAVMTSWKRGSIMGRTPNSSPPPLWGRSRALPSEPQRSGGKARLTRAGGAYRTKRTPHPARLSTWPNRAPYIARGALNGFGQVQVAPPSPARAGLSHMTDCGHEIGVVPSGALDFAA
jgi:hypothetical protein